MVAEGAAAGDRLSRFDRTKIATRGKSAKGHAETRENQAEKLLPQPQVPLTFGLLNLNPEP